MTESLKYTNEDLGALEKELKKNPSAYSSYIRLADAQLALGKKQQAFSTYRAVRVICPDNPEVLKIGAKVFEALDKREEAIDCLQKAIRLHGAVSFDSESASHLAELLYNSGKKEEALSLLRKLVAVSGSDPKLLMKIAQVQLSLGNLLEAQNYLKEYKAKAGPTREMFILMGQAMLSRGFYDGAVKNYSDAIADFPRDSQMHLGLGKAWLGMKDKNIALKEFSEAVRLNPDDVNILLELGKLQSEIGLVSEADETFAKIENLKHQNGEVFLEIGKYFVKRNNNIRGLKYLEIARSLSAFHPEILKLTCELYVKLARYEYALKLYSDSVKSEPEALWPYEGIVFVADRLGKNEVKAEAQKKLLSMKSSTADEYCDYAETLIKLGMFDEAHEAFDYASKLDSTCLRAFQAPETILLEKSKAEGEKLAKQGKEALEKHFYMTAVNKIEKAMEIEPDNPRWARLLAEVYYKTGDFKKASRYLSVVRASEPADFEVGYRLARAYEFSGDYQMAIELLTSIIKLHPISLEAHLMLLRLKRCQIRSSRITADMVDSIVKNISFELAEIKRDSPVYLLVKGYVYYLFTFNTSMLVDGLNKAEACFKEVLTSFGQDADAYFALALCERVRGNIDKAVEYMKNYLSLSKRSDKTIYMATMLENFRKYKDALTCYEELRKQFPEKGLYRRKYVEMTARLQNETGKNQLNMLMSRCNREHIDNPESIWPIYESALAQELASKKDSTLSKEWQKRSMLSWRKAEDCSELNSWVVDEMVRCMLDGLTGTDRVKKATSLKKTCEKTMRVALDVAESYLSTARCFLAFNDLTNKDNALNYLERAWFLDDSRIETGELLAETAKYLGKSHIVDVVGYNVILSEPEIANAVFKFL